MHHGEEELVALDVTTESCYRRPVHFKMAPREQQLAGARHRRCVSVQHDRTDHVDALIFLTLVVLAIITWVLVGLQIVWAMAS